MKVFLVAAAVGISSVVLSGCSETSGGQANAERRSTSIRMCTAAVGKRANTTVVSLVRTQSFERYTAVWLEVGNNRRQWQCNVEESGPGTYFIQTIRRV